MVSAPVDRRIPGWTGKFSVPAEMLRIANRWWLTTRVSSPDVSPVTYRGSQFSGSLRRFPGDGFDRLHSPASTSGYRPVWRLVEPVPPLFRFSRGRRRLHEEWGVDDET